jgi:uncharacterized OB-fold protein
VSMVRARPAAPSLQMTLGWKLRREQSDRVEIRCVRCGYGAVVPAPPRRCPMCGRDGWQLAKHVGALSTLSE